MPLSELEFGSYLSYTPRPSTEAGRLSKNAMWSIKQNKLHGNPRVSSAQLVVQRLVEHRVDLPFRHFFQGSVIAVPVPRSSLAKPGSLWVPLAICHALKEAGLVSEVLACLTRKRALPKSATSEAGDRSTAHDHYLSLEVQRVLTAPDSFLLVDDIITRGAALLGAAQRLQEAYPGVPISGFAAMRTISDGADFRCLTAPCLGTVILRGDQTFRRP